MLKINFSKPTYSACWGAFSSSSLCQWYLPQSAHSFPEDSPDPKKDRVYHQLLKIKMQNGIFSAGWQMWPVWKCEMQQRFVWVWDGGRTAFCSCNFCLDRLSLKCNSSFRNEIQTPLNADLGDMQRLYEPGAQLFWSPPTTGHSHTTWGGWNPQTPGVPNELVVQNLKVILSYLDWPLRMVWVETVNLKIIMKVIEPTLKALSNLIKHIGEEFVASLQNAEGVQWFPARRTVRSLQRGGGKCTGQSYSKKGWF